MQCELLFSTKNSDLTAFYTAIVSSAQFSALAPGSNPTYWSVENVDTDYESWNAAAEVVDGEDPEGHVDNFCVNMRAIVKTGPFAESWEREELWGYNCNKEGIASGTYGSEVIAQFDRCKVIIPHTTDRDLYENVVVWWDFPCTRLNGSAIFARNIIFLFDSE